MTLAGSSECCMISPARVVTVPPHSISRCTNTIVRVSRSIRNIKLAETKHAG